MNWYIVIAVIILSVLLVSLQEAEGDTCKPTVYGGLIYDVKDGDGNKWYNEDNYTLYPGDRVRYWFTVKWNNCNCGTFERFTDQGAIKRISGSNTSGIVEANIAKTNDCHGGGSKGIQGYGGDDGWDRGVIKDRCGSITLTAGGKTLHCDPETGACACIHFGDDSKTLYPRTMAPVTETILTEHILLDPYRYNATNNDMTNYPWDPIAIEHEADFEFNEDRAGTISFEYTRHFDELIEEGGWECTDENDSDGRCTTDLTVSGVCPHNTIPTPECTTPNDMPPNKVGKPEDAFGIGFLPYSLGVELGGGMYAYTAPANTESKKYTRNHEIRYDVKIFNEGRLINTHTNSTKQLVVKYDPEWHHYEYPVLGDSKRFAYDDRQGIVIRYGGSHGSGADDNNLLNPDRRARINAFYQNSTMYSTRANDLTFDDDILLLNNPIIITPARLEWDSIDHILGMNKTEWTSEYTGTNSVDFSYIPESSGDGHAIFYGAAYGILRFAQEISDLILDPTHYNKWYHDTQIYNEIASDRWGGYDSFMNWNYTYRYPHTPFSQWVNMTSYNSDGFPSNSELTISIDSTYTHGATNIPDLPDKLNEKKFLNVIVPMDEYMMAKTFHDSEDPYFAAGVFQEMPLRSWTSNSTEGNPIYPPGKFLEIHHREVEKEEEKSSWDLWADLIQLPEGWFKQEKDDINNTNLPQVTDLIHIDNTKTTFIFFDMPVNLSEYGKSKFSISVSGTEKKIDRVGKLGSNIIKLVLDDAIADKTNMRVHLKSGAVKSHSDKESIEYDLLIADNKQLAMLVSLHQRPNKIIILFNVEVTAAKDNFAMTVDGNSRKIIDVVVNKQSVIIQFDGDDLTDETAKITISGVKDLDGNSIKTTTTHVTNTNVTGDYRYGVSDEVFIEIAEWLLYKMPEKPQVMDGIGTLGMWYNKTALEFRQGNYPDGIMEVSRYHNLDQDVSAHVNMTTGNTHVEEQRLFEFWDDYHVEFGQGNDWKLEGERIRDTDMVIIKTPWRFGEIERILVDDRMVKAGYVDCDDTCTLRVPTNSTISIENKWGGIASTDIEEPESMIPPDPQETLEAHYDYLYYFLAVGIVVFIAYKVLKRFFRAVHGEDIDNNW